MRAICSLGFNNAPACQPARCACKTGSRARLVRRTDPIFVTSLAPPPGSAEIRRSSRTTGTWTALRTGSSAQFASSREAWSIILHGAIGRTILPASQSRVIVGRCSAVLHFASPGSGTLPPPFLVRKEAGRQPRNDSSVTSGARPPPVRRGSHSAGGARPAASAIIFDCPLSCRDPK